MTASVQRTQSSAAVDKLAFLWPTPLKASRALNTPKRVFENLLFIGGLSQRPYYSNSTGQGDQRDRRLSPSFAPPARYRRDHRRDDYTATRKEPRPPRVTGPVKVIVNGEERLESRGMMWSSSILTGLSADSEPSFMIQFDSAKYIFNVSENTTRSFKSSGRSWRRTRGIFFTQSKIERVGGLPGLIMTMADGAIDKLKLTGPTGLNHLLASMRTFTYRDSIAVETAEVAPTSSAQTPCYSDENITVYPIPLNPDLDAIASSTTAEDTTTSEYADPDESSKRKREESPPSPRKRRSVALQAYMNANSFSPVELNGALAEEYRERIIEKMFPGTNIPSAASKHDKQLGDGIEPDNSAVDEDKRPQRDLLPGFFEQLPNLTPRRLDSTTSYFIVGPKFRGKFDAAKAKELKIPIGPMRANLTRGETITFNVVVDGETISRTVRPEDVVGKPDTPGALAILDVPSVAHIASLSSTFSNSSLYSTVWSSDGVPKTAEDPPYVVRTVYHICGPGVLEDASYKTFMRGFGADVHHIVASPDYCANQVSFPSVSHNQFLLSHLDGKIFPVPKYANVPKKDISSIPNLPANVLAMSRNLLSSIRPLAPPTPEELVSARDKFTPLTSGAIPLELSPALKKAIAITKRNLKQVVERGQTHQIEGADVGVVALGTGGSMPSTHRNVLSTLIRIPGHGNMLLDAGEGTWGQIARTFGLEDGPDNAWEVLRNLKCIFISHIHGDHHIGLAQILSKRRQLDPLPSEPLYVVSIRPTLLYLREMNEVQDLGIDDPSGNGVITVTSESLHWANRPYATSGVWRIGGNEPWLDINESKANARKMCDALGLEYFKAIDVHHRCRCYGCTFKHKNGWSITFSGDTAPTENLRQAGQNSTLLIHEASMCNDEWRLAAKKAHSTIGQAVEQGHLMNAKATMLTHFSARYPRFPPGVHLSVPMRRTAAEYKADDMKMVVAFDHMNLTMGDMWKMEFYNPVISQVFRDTYDQSVDEELISDTESTNSHRSHSRSPAPIRSRSPSQNDNTRPRSPPRVPY